MATATTIDLNSLAGELQLRFGQVENVVALLDDDNTVPFITRYRKDQTGGLDEEQIRQIKSRVERLRLLDQRKQTILRSIDSQGKLTPELLAQIEKADSVKRLEDLYLPFKPRKQTLATAARQRGLEPLADEILQAAASCQNLDARAADFVNEDRDVRSAADALLGCGHILAERFSEHAELRGKLRKIVSDSGRLVTTRAVEEEKQPAPPPAAPPAPESAPSAVAGESDKPADNTAGDHAGKSAETAAKSAEKNTGKTERKKGKKGKKDGAKAANAFRDFFEFSEAIGKIPPHRVLAINRGDRAKALRVKIEADQQALHQTVDEFLVPGDHPHAEFLRGCARDALARLILPSLEREFRRELTDQAETHAVRVFARNLRNLLLQSPVRGRRVLAVDPGFKSGCKLVALDEFGGLLEHGLLYVTGKDEERRTAAKATLAELVRKHNCGVIAIGNGTACRETELLVAELIGGELKDEDVAFVIVNEAGASVYSTSPVGREEFPELDATIRGAISIGRRLQDPLSELVKIEPANIGVGMYQHDVKAKHLQTSLDEVVESCVNFVGVDLNTASVSLLRYVSGLNQLTARRIAEYRAEHGPFKNRDGILAVPGLGERTFVQAAGFLRIPSGENPLDATWIHPESYETARGVLSRAGFEPGQLSDREAAEQLAGRAAELDLEQLSAELQVGTLLLKDIITQLARPGRDPREDLPPPRFRREVLKLEDLQPGMELAGSVLNVVDFGAFVDIGLKDSGLVHISQLSGGYVQDPHQVVAVGDQVQVWVLNIDKERRRVGLTMIQPGSEQPRGRKRASEGERGKRRGRKPTKRPPRKGKPPAGSGGRRHHERKSRVPAPKITKDMAAGKEPMRTFGDLKQFFELQESPPDSNEQES